MKGESDTERERESAASAASSHNLGHLVKVAQMQFTRNVLLLCKLQLESLNDRKYVLVKGKCGEWQKYFEVARNLPPTSEVKGEYTCMCEHTVSSLSSIFASSHRK